MAGRFPDLSLTILHSAFAGAVTGLAIGGLEQLCGRAGSDLAIEKLALLTGTFALLGVVPGLLQALSPRQRRARLFYSAAFALPWAVSLFVATGASGKWQTQPGWAALSLLLAIGVWLGITALGYVGPQGFEEGDSLGAWWASPSRRRIASATSLGFVLAAGSAVENARIFRSYPRVAEQLLVNIALLSAMLVGCLIPARGLDRRRQGVGALLVLVVGALGVGRLAVVPVGGLLLTDGASFTRLGLVAWMRLTDSDGDGSSAYFGGGDCAPDEPNIHPRARDIPGNGVDENCNGADAPIAVVSGSKVGSAEPSKPSPVSVVLITIDTLRADHLTFYGSKNDTTPNWAQWASRGTVYDAAHTSGGSTPLALGALHFGVEPRKIAWTRFYKTQERGLVRRGTLEALGMSVRGRVVFTLPAAESRATLSEMLKGRGMATSAVVDDGPWGVLAPGTGFERGFDSYRVVRPADDDVAVGEIALTELRRLKGGERFFLWVHFFGPHEPNRVHRGTATFGSRFVDGYDHEIRHVDDQLSALLSELGEMQEETLVVMSSDHGEHLGAMSRGHGVDVSCPATRVPLVIRGPGFSSGREKADVSLLDLAPTILGATETPHSAELGGQDLAQPIADRVLTSESFREKWSGGLALDQIAFIRRGRRIAMDRLLSQAVLYHDDECAEAPTKLHRVQEAPTLERALREQLDLFSGGPIVTD